MLEQLSHLLQKPETTKRLPPLTARTAILAVAVALGVLGTLGWFLTRARAPETSVATSPPPSAQAPLKSKLPGRG